MIRLPLGESAFKRLYGLSPEIRMVNRFFEVNPAVAEGASLLSRPGVGRFAVEGADVAYRALFAQPGVFEGDLFVVSYDGTDAFLRRYGDVVTEIAGAELIGERISFAAASGLFFENLFIASDAGLSYYQPTTFAEAYIRVAATGITDQGVRVGDVYYQFGTGDGGDGSSGSPFIVFFDSDAVDSAVADYNLYGLQALKMAINYEAFESGARPYSSTITGKNLDIRAEEPGDRKFDIGGGAEVARNYLPLMARVAGPSGNALALDVTAGNLIVGNGVAESSAAPITFAGGAEDTLADVVVPDDVDIFKVVSLSNFVLALEQSSNRFFFIRPGNTTIDALDYESAESEPDNLVDAIRVGDLAWLFGESSIEAWYASGDAARPVQRMPGMAFRVGMRQGTAAVVGGNVVFVGRDNVVYMVTGRPEPISHPGIEERIRRGASLLEGTPEFYAWSFDLDGHSFYVLSIDTQGTVVYDAATKQWQEWVTGADPFWRMVKQGARYGDHALAIDWLDRGVWVVDPGSMFDVAELEEDADIPIERVVTGIYPHRERSRVRNHYLRVYGSVGAPDVFDPAPVLRLRFSDTNGVTWEGPYDVELTEVETQELYFNSLGMIGAPGRVFELSDVGGLVRIDGAYVEVS